MQAAYWQRIILYKTDNPLREMPESSYWSGKVYSFNGFEGEVKEKLIQLIKELSELKFF